MRNISDKAYHMTREELLSFLRSIEDIVRAETDDNLCDASDFHLRADMALLSYINDPEITAAYTAIERWYS